MWERFGISVIESQQNLLWPHKIMLACKISFMWERSVLAIYTILLLIYKWLHPSISTNIIHKPNINATYSSNTPVVYKIYTKCQDKLKKKIICGPDIILKNQITQNYQKIKDIFFTGFNLLIVKELKSTVRIAGENCLSLKQ